MPSTSRAKRARRDCPSSPASGAHLIDFVGLGVAVVLFCILALWQLHLPGLYNDEAYDAAPAVLFMRGIGGWPYSLLPGSLDLPLMVCDHVGPTSTYLMMPFLYAWGIGPHAVRLYEFACGLAAVLLIFFWARRVAPPGAAWVAALLAAATPSVWLACRNGLHVSFIVVPLAAGALIAFDRWYRHGSRSWFLLGCFLSGVGLSTKILFVWFIAAVGAGILVVKREVIRRPVGRDILLGALSFAIGLGPFLLYNLLSRGQTFRTIVTAAGETPYGIRNTAVLANLWTQLKSLSALLGGSWLDWTGVTPHNPAAVILFAAAALYLIARARQPGMRRAVLCLIAVPLILFASCFTISTLHPKHLVILLPFTPVVVVAALGDAWARRARPASAAVFGVLAALCVVQLGWDLRSNVRYHRALAATGGVSLFSSAHNALAEYLTAEDITRPLVGSWGLQDNLTVLSRGRIAVESIFELTEPAPYEFTRERVRRTLTDPASVYLFHDEAVTAAPGRLDTFLEVAEESGVEVELGALFADGTGSPIVRVYRIASPPE